MRMPCLIIFVFALMLALPADAQTQGGNGRGNSGYDGNDRDSNQTGDNWPPRRVKKQPPPRRVIIVPQKPVPTRRTRPKPPRRVPKPLPGHAVLGTPIDLTHSVRTPLIRGDVRLLPDGDFEFIAVGPQDESAAAVLALTGAGAAFLRQSNYPNIDRRSLVFDANGLTLQQIRELLDTAAPGTEADTHAIYRFASGTPRLYAAEMVATPDSATCTLPDRLRIGQIDGAIENTHPVLKETGIITHSVLQNRSAAARRDHGTAVAALMVGQDETGALAGFAPGATLLAAAAFGAEGAGGATDVERIAAALDWLVGQDVRLINLSFAGPANRALEELLRTVAEKQVVLIAAAGNQGVDGAVFPAGAETVIGVTAVDAAMRRYRSANTGDHVDFAAPGVDLYVANSEGGGYASGTSYAAPILTALAARLVGNGVTDPDTLRDRLRQASVDLGDSGRDPAFGWGLAKVPGC